MHAARTRCKSTIPTVDQPPNVPAGTPTSQIRPSKWKLALALLAALGLAGSLRADNLTYTVTPNAGQFSYQFTLSNTGDTGGTLFDLFISLQTDIGTIDTATIRTPAGWGDPTGGLLFFGPDVAPSTSFIEWASDFSGTFDVGIGDSLSGFSFNSSVLIAPQITFASDGSTVFADAQDVTATPEPSAFCLMASVALLLGVRTRFSGRRRLKSHSFWSGPKAEGVRTQVSI